MGTATPLRGRRLSPTPCRKHAEVRREAVPACRADAQRGSVAQRLHPDEIDDIHLATLEVLERTGVFVEDDEPLDIFADGGCRIDRETRMVCIPPHVVAEALAACPPSIMYCGRTPTATSSSSRGG